MTCGPHPHTSQLLLRQPDIVISDIGSIKQAGRGRPLLATAGQRLIMRPANKNKYLQEAVTRVPHTTQPCHHSQQRESLQEIKSVDTSGFMVNNGVGRLQMQD